MVRELTERDIDALIARHIEPYPGDPRIGEYRLREEDNGYPVWSVIGSLAPDGSNIEQVTRGFAISREAINDRLAANRDA
jgi:hypothetical protein